jgi:hypothetical protein
MTEATTDKEGRGHRASPCPAAEVYEGAIVDSGLRHSGAATQT